MAKLNFDRIEVFVNIGQMYSKDEEFIKDIEQYHAVLSSFLIKAMNSYMKNIQK
ncbi:MAG: TipAS antibiotic-recognition domain-containing protein [Anaerorhabdus sp.]|uniref:TipAS antibiotic-recognition domain-containing protein n=1 Tax=Anaerorhabdus sp. TaxID=1872524 RepID=UPI003A8A27DB